MEFITGGLLKAAVHRGEVAFCEPDRKALTYYPLVVYEPPEDQRQLVSSQRLAFTAHITQSLCRLGLFYFATMLPEVPLQPLLPLAGRGRPPTEGVFDEFEGRTPTAGGAFFRCWDLRSILNRFL
jgi:hypothetical protein